MRDVVSLSGLWVTLPLLLSEVHSMKSSIRMENELFGIAKWYPKKERAFQASIDNLKGLW